MDLVRPRAVASRVVHAVVVVVAVTIALLILVPRLTGHELYVITSGSMTGTADVGSLVVSNTVPTRDLEVGDVITYMPPAETGIDHLVTHRIAAIDSDDFGLLVFATKGDANAQADPWTFNLQDQVQPRMRAVIPWLGFPVLWLANRTTRMVVIGGPAVLIALLAARDLVRAVRRPASTVTDPDDASRDDQEAEAHHATHDVSVDAASQHAAPSDLLADEFPALPTTS